ncbi:MAG: helix-turn-helix transcriptional regulator [Candidatus Micrarchaeia archaeon]
MALSTVHYAKFGMLLIGVGMLLLFISIITGITMLIAFYSNIITIHSIKDIDVNVIKVTFNFILPFIGGILLVLAGSTIESFSRTVDYRNYKNAQKSRQEKKKASIEEKFLNNDERKILSIVKGAPNGILQSELVIKTGYSKVKVHRILKKLENSDFIRRGRFGITNKVFINK